MKRILIIHPSMEIGGAERALLGLLDTLDYDNYQVDLLLCSHTGDFMPLINGHVNLLPYDRRFDFFQSPVSQLMRQGQWAKAAIRLWAKFAEHRRARRRGLPHSVWHAQQIIHRAMEPLLPKVKGHYDLAINFLGIPSILVRCVDADMKMAWIHTDYNKIVADPQLDRRMFSHIDRIVNVSEDCKRIFDSIYPEFASRSIVIENILNTSLVKKLADEPEDIPFSKDTLNLLSIGRFGEAKNFENIPEICRLLTEKGVRRFKWYIIGYGGMESLIRENIKRFRMGEHVEILGKRVNPYPYIKACDIYLQPSRFEGKAVTVREAQMLGKPVIVTAYPTAAGQIAHGLDGLILPMDTQAFAAALADILADTLRDTLRDTPLLNALAAHCQTHTFGNESEINKIYNLIR